MSLLDTKTWLWSKLSTDTPLLTALGDTVGDINHIFPNWPDDFETLPIVTFTEIDNHEPESAFRDDYAVSQNCTFEFHVFTGLTADTTPIAQLIDNILSPLKWTRTYSTDAESLSVKIRHRVARYQRLVAAGDLI